MSKNSRISIYPGFNAYYYSFYLDGLRSLFGSGSIEFSVRGFPRFGHHCLAVIVEGRPERRLYISAGDGSGINQQGLDWCDVYAKVNLDPENLPPRDRHKLLPIGPSFGVRIWSMLPLLWHAAANYWRCGGGVDSTLATHFANYWRQRRYRLPETAYRPATSRPDFVFFAASLWKKEPATNTYRARFIEACRALPGLHVEGGFAPRQRHDIDGFDHLTLRKSYPLREYLEKTKQAAVVFNTPGVAGCLGWKLAEFLALGKAILSLATARLLPAPLEHGTHVHYVDGSARGLQEAVAAICSDGRYRARLEAGARQYYDTYLKPTSVIQRILEAAEGEPGCALQRQAAR